ncbi:M23 family metallopeptidase [Candidatus Parcubacteria bacterium]|nr:MAG: M23 family metallopeptidase [Candidatus Parcubacteria bacterium]
MRRRQVVYLLFLFAAGLAMFIRITDLLQDPPQSSREEKNSFASGGIDLRDVARIRTLVTQGYGSRRYFFISYAKGYHNGVDIAAKSGASIYSPAYGEVVAAGDQDKFCHRGNYGRFIVLRSSSDGAALLFAHLNALEVGIGDTVAAGGIVGSVGRTGRATAPHLHFTVFKKGTFELRDKEGCGPNPEGVDTNPMRYLESL